MMYAKFLRFQSFGLFVAMCLIGAVRSAVAEEPVKSLIDSGLSAWQAFHAEDGTTIEDVWSVTDEKVLVCRGEPQGYLYTREKYEDLELEFEWRWPPGQEAGRGGVLLRTSGKHQVWPKSLEVQLNVGDAGDYWGLIGYELKGPAEKMNVIEHPKYGKLTNVKKDKPLEKEAGQWNHCRVRLVGEKVTTEMNGQKINEATGCEAGAGPVCFTAEGNGIQFRNIRVQKLK